MSFELIGPGDPDPLDPSDGWGDIPVADRPLWSRYMVDHLPWFPGVTIMNLMVPGVMKGGTRAPRIWKDAARGLHAQGFTPLQYYLLATLLRQALAAGELDERIHAPLFEQWFDERRSSTTFRLAPSAWQPWLDRIANAESPGRALDHVLHGDDLPPLGSLSIEGRPPRLIGD